MGFVAKVESFFDIKVLIDRKMNRVHKEMLLSVMLVSC